MDMILHPLKILLNTGKKIMLDKEFMQTERDQLFWKVLREYQEEGYSFHEAKYMAQRVTDDVMSDKETFVDNYIRDTFPDDDE